MINRFLVLSYIQQVVYYCSLYLLSDFQSPECPTLFVYWFICGCLESRNINIVYVLVTKNIVLN